MLGGNRSFSVLKTLIPYILVALLGLLVLVGVEPSPPNNEHWDNPIYWYYAYPFLCVACGGLGYFFPKNSWSYGFIAMWVQAIPALVENINAELIGVSVLLLLLLCLPPALSGILGGWIKRRHTDVTEHHV